MERIGISIHPDAIRVVAMRGPAVLWTGESSVVDQHALAAEIAAVLATVPQSRLRRREVIGAIGPHAAQLKRISGVPLTAGDRVLSDAIRLNAPRFFLTNGSPLLTSNVVRRENELWCAAADAPVVEALAAACRTARIVFRGCIPSGAASTGAMEAGAADSRFEDAINAAGSGGRSPFLIDPGGKERVIRRQSTVRIVLGGLLAVAAAVASVAPAIRANVREHAALARLRALSTQSAAPLADMRTFSGADDIVRRVDAFVSSRRSALVLLGSLSQVLPDSTAIVSFHVDSTGGTLVALTAVRNTILPDISRATGVVSAEISGAVTRETVSGASVQRLVATFRFTRPRAARPVRVPGGSQ